MRQNTAKTAYTAARGGAITHNMRNIPMGIMLFSKKIKERNGLKKEKEKSPLKKEKTVTLSESHPLAFFNSYESKNAATWMGGGGITARDFPSKVVKSSLLV